MDHACFCMDRTTWSLVHRTFYSGMTDGEDHDAKFPSQGGFAGTARPLKFFRGYPISSLTDGKVNCPAMKAYAIDFVELLCFGVGS